ncbi:MAG TPA: ATP-binding protein, partial [Amaricoccus sp.]|nr:ATP-binding protein [Amaricoccus sp.]
LKHDGGDAWLLVQDAGPGIDRVDQERIFNEFERLSREDQPGSGLGLSIVRRACELLEHEVALDSMLGRGSRFRVRLPLIRERGPLVHHGEGPERGGLPADFTGRRVLIVENDPGMRQAFSMLLHGWGMEVSDAGGIAEARAVVREGVVPDLVLTDYRLDARETGVQTIEILRADLDEPVPALIVSAESSEAIRRLADPLGVPVLEKPVAESELRQALAALLAGAA